MPDLDAFVDHIDDDVLRLIFLTCHPALSPESRAALTLRLVGGLTVPEIARAFLTKDATVGQRISRAKKTLAGESFELPVGREREERLDDVMGVLYLIFNEGYTATSGDDWMRPDLCAEGIRLARMLAGLAPLEPDVHGLLALMELQASRLHARTDDEGRPVLLDDQDRATWDALLIRRGLASLDRAMALGRPDRALRDPGPDRRLPRPRRAAPRRPTGPRSPGGTTCWLRSATTRWSRSTGPWPTAAPTARRPGLAILDAVAGHAALAGSHLVPSVRGDLLERTGRRSEAADAFTEAAALTDNGGERTLLLGRAERARSGA